MIFYNGDILIVGSCLLALQADAVIQVKFFHRRNRIISPAENFPDSLSGLSQATASQESLHLPSEQVSEDVEVGQQGESDEELVGGDSEAVLTQGVSRLAEVTVEPDSQVVQETGQHYPGHQPVAVVATAQVQVGGHLEVLDVGHHG